MRRALLLVAFAVAASLTATGCSDTSADDRLRTTLGVPDSQPLTSALVAERLGKLLPPGTPEALLAAKAHSAGIGKDELSSYRYLKEQNLAVIRIEFDRASFATMKTSWIISLKLDASQKLESIAVERYLTGL